MVSTLTLFETAFDPLLITLASKRRGWIDSWYGLLILASSSVRPRLHTGSAIGLAVVLRSSKLRSDA
jgi:hypothetical protein